MEKGKRIVNQEFFWPWVVAIVVVILEVSIFAWKQKTMMSGQGAAMMVLAYFLASCLAACMAFFFTAAFTEKEEGPP